MDSGDSSALRRWTRQQSLTYMIDLIEKRNRSSHCANPKTHSVDVNTGEDAACGRKRKMVQRSTVDKRKTMEGESSVQELVSQSRNNLSSKKYLMMMTIHWRRRKVIVMLLSFEEEEETVNNLGSQYWVEDCYAEYN